MIYPSLTLQCLRTSQKWCVLITTQLSKVGIKYFLYLLGRDKAALECGVLAIWGEDARFQVFIGLPIQEALS